jgi:hypothetical protein
MSVEQRRNGFAFTLQRRGGFFRNDAHRRHGLRSGRFAISIFSAAVKRGGALAAKIESRWIFERTIRAGQAERSSALPAELHAGRILEFALRAAHRRSLQFPWADARVSPGTLTKENRHLRRRGNEGTRVLRAPVVELKCGSHGSSRLR